MHFAGLFCGQSCGLRRGEDQIKLLRMLKLAGTSRKMQRDKLYESNKGKKIRKIQKTQLQNIVL